MTELRFQRFSARLRVIFPEICRKIIRLLRRNAVPRIQICIVHAFLSVRTAGKNVVSDGVTVPAVFFRGCGYRIFLSGKKQSDDFIVIHVFLPFLAQHPSPLQTTKIPLRYRNTKKEFIFPVFRRVLSDSEQYSLFFLHDLIA